ncbi:hypothetical protein AAFC00_001587 [Neodothiora populina]|uniref:Uncharacterized protein n=1 Tax=Neodothiora populina TaxID=2781224 RepID=A0ABR3PPN5_9PEZI
MTSAIYQSATAYSRRSASTQANEIDRNLMFYYEHLQLYDPNSLRRSRSEPLHSLGLSQESLDLPQQQPRSARQSLDMIAAMPAPQTVQDSLSGPVTQQVLTEQTTQEQEPEYEPQQQQQEPLDSIVEESQQEQQQEQQEQLQQQQQQQQQTEESRQDAMSTRTSIREDPPPHYDHHHLHRLQLPPAYETMPDSLLPDPSFCHPELAENLRRFLLFCLAIDYGLVPECPEPMRPTDWLPFLRLARHWSWRDSRRRYQQGYDPVRPAFLGNPSRADNAADDERALKVEQCIFACIVRPAQALNIPPDIAITMLRDFPSSITSNGDYVPHNHRYRCPNTKTLATKLLLDREILIDTLTRREHSSFRSSLHEANEKIQNKNFVSLRSPDDFELTQFGMMREKLEGGRRATISSLSLTLTRSPEDNLKAFVDSSGRKRLKRWVRKLSSA